MLEPIAPAKNKTDKTVVMVFISLSPPFRPWLAFVPCDITAREKIPSEKILLSGIFCLDAKFQGYVGRCHRPLPTLSVQQRRAEEMVSESGGMV
jgi:hypothetical protein